MEKSRRKVRGDGLRWRKLMEEAIVAVTAVASEVAGETWSFLPAKRRMKKNPDAELHGNNNIIIMIVFINTEKIYFKFYNLS